MHSRHPATPAAKPSALERALPPAFRRHLEGARIELRALFRASDQLGIGQDIHLEMHRLFELDADFAEALHVLDVSPRDISVGAMLRDTKASLSRIAAVRADFLASLDVPSRESVEARLLAVRATLVLQDAYIDIPGRDPAVVR